MNVLPWAISLTVFLVLFVRSLIREPYRKYREKAEELEKFTKKRLKIEVIKEPQLVELRKKTYWWAHLTVHNPCANPIQDCYAELLSFTPNKNNRPYQGIHLPWSSYSSGSVTQTLAIGGRGCAILDVAVTNGINLYIPTLSPEAGRRDLPFAEPPGEYIAEIQVGSKVESFLPTRIALRIVLKDGSLRIKRSRSGR